MPVKPPRGGSTHVDVPGSSSRSVQADTLLPGPSGRRGANSGISLDNPHPRAGSSGDASVDAIRPAPAVVVHMAPDDIRPPAAAPLLENYVINAGVMLPGADSRGIRVFNKQTYVDLSEGGTVLVAMDLVEATVRARLSRERYASGPELVRDNDSGLWHAREVVDSTLRAQVKQYLAQLSDRQADDFVSRFGDKETVEAELKRIQSGLPQLERELSVWTDALKDSPGAERASRLLMSSKLIQLYKWQGDSLDPWGRVYRGGRMVGFKAYIDLSAWPMQMTPVFSTPINSVVSLTLRGPSPLVVKDFFAAFPNVEVLRASGQMNGLPDGVGMLKALRVADLSDPWGHIAPADIEQLKKLPRLQELNLEGQTVGYGFSVRGMAQLRVLKLGNTGLLDLPGGLSELAVRSRLEVLDLQRNPYIRNAPDVTGMSELRILDLTHTGINQLPVGLGAENGPKGLQVLKLGENALLETPSLEGMSKLQELDLSNTDIDTFPEGITSEIPRTVLNLANNRIRSIPESVELRAGFNLTGNPVSDPASLRRLIFARRQTGTDIWLGVESVDTSADLWLRHVPQAQVPEKLALWDRLNTISENNLFKRIRNLSRTPEFFVERQLLERRVWAFLEHFEKAGAVEKSRLRSIAKEEVSPGQMLDRLEEELKAFDPGRQNHPLHHLPKRPRVN